MKEVEKVKSFELPSYLFKSSVDPSRIFTKNTVPENIEDDDALRSQQPPKPLEIAPLQIQLISNGQPQQKVLAHPSDTHLLRNPESTHTSLKKLF